MSTTAVRDGDDWILNGAKNFITHAISGDIAVVMTRTGEKGEKNNATAFVFEKGMEGFSSGKKENKLGIDRKSTRLNSSHVAISYAVFCLKKNTTKSNNW